MDQMEFVREALEKFGKASVTADFIGSAMALHVSWKLDCWVKYDRAADTYHFKR